MAHIVTSPDAEKDADIEWQILVAGSQGEISVKAASITEELAVSPVTTASVHHIGGERDLLLTILRDESGEVVFRAPAQAVVYIRRRQ